MPEIERDMLAKEALPYQARQMLRHHPATTCNPSGQSPRATMQQACLFWLTSLPFANCVMENVKS